MITRFSLLASALALAATPTLHAQMSSFSYADGKHRYRMESTTKVSQELQGQTMDAELRTRHLLTVDVARKAKDTLAIGFTWDSASITTVGPVPTPDLSKVAGTKSSGLASPAGEVYSFDPGQALAEGMPTMEEFEHFLPVVERTNKKLGDTWVDTLTIDGNRNGMQVNTTMIVTSTYAADTTFAGEKSWRIHRNLAFTVAGVGQQQGMALTIEGTGTGEREDYISSKGVYLGSELTQSSTSTVSLPANGMTIPMTTTVTSRVERVKG